MQIQSDDENLEKNLNLKIIISGTKIDKSIVKLIINKKSSYEFCSIDMNTNEEYTMTSFDKPKWDFYEFKDGFNDKIKDKIYDIIHLNFGLKGRTIETTLIFFTDEDEDDISLLEYLDEKNTYFHPFIIFITKNSKKDKEYYKNYIKENELDFDERNIYIINIDKIETRIIQEKLFKILWKTCCYYNGIGDNMIFPGLELISIQKELNIKYNNCLNLFIIGKPGSGKSRLVNVICNEKKAHEKIGNGVSNKVTKYFIGDFPLALYDTEGFRSRKDIDLIMNNIEDKMKQITDDREQIHGIFYMINQKSTRTLDEGEIILIKFILENKIPLFFLLNYSKYKDINNKKRNDYLESLLIVLEKDFPKTNISKYIYLINLKNDNEGNIIFGLDKLFNDLYNYYLPNKIEIEELNYNFDDDINNILKCINHSIFFKNITQLKDALKICKSQAQKAIGLFLISSLFIGISPIPCSDIYQLSSLEFILFNIILGIYKINLNKLEIKNALKSFGTSSAIACVGFGIGHSLLLIPGVGTILGIIIRGSIASITILGIGNLCIKYCEENYDKINYINFYKNLASNYNFAIDGLKEVSQNFKKNE